MMEKIKAILTLLSLSLESCIILAFFTGMCLFLPESILEKFTLNIIIQDYRMIISIMFMFAISSIVVKLGGKLFTSIKQEYYKYKIKKAQKRYLNNLDDYQTNIVKELLNSYDYTHEFNCKSGSIKRLEHYQIIFRTANESCNYNYNMSEVNFPYTLNPWVLEEINNNKQLKDKFSLAFDRSTR